MGLRTLASGCPNFTKIDRIFVENKLPEVAKCARKSFDKKASFVFVCSLLCLLLGVKNSQLTRGCLSSLTLSFSFLLLIFVVVSY